MSIPSGRQWKIQSIRPCAGDACRFSVTLERGNDCIHDVKLEAAELLEYRAFQARILKMSGRLVRFALVESASDPAVAWLDLVEALLTDDPVKKPTRGFMPSPPPRRFHTLDGAAQEMTEIGGGD